MPTARPFAFNNTGLTYSKTSQFGDITVARPGANLGSIPLEWYNGADEDPGFIISHTTTSTRTIGNNHNVSTGRVVAHWRSTSKTDQSFLDLFESVKLQTGCTLSFATASDAASWLTSNGFWTSYGWSYDSATFLSWPPDSSGYTLYTGGFNAQDDGNANSAIVSIDTFEMNAQGPSNQIYLSTNGYITLGSGSGQIIGTPQQQISPAAIAGNPSDLYMVPGQVLTDGDTSNVYYKTGGSSGKSYLKLLVYQGTYGALTTPSSYILNIYVDSTYQWVETRAKSNLRGSVGPYNISDVSQPSSTTSQVWRGDLSGQNWVYLGTGTVI